MKKFLTTLLTAGALLITVHRMPAPISEVTETPSATPAPKPAKSQPPEEKAQPKKPKPKSTTTPEPENAGKHGRSEQAQLPVAGTWRGRWDNSRGDQGTTFLVFDEGPGGVITGDTEALPFSGRPPLQNGHRTGNTITFSFHRGNRDYHVTGTFSSDGATLSGQYKVVQDQKVIYTGKYFDFKRQ